MSHVDLSALRIDPAATRLPPRPWGPRVLGAVALVLLLAVAATFSWPLLRPARVVPMAPVRAATAAGAATAATAEAVGWVEADPFPTIVRPLVQGRIESIHVLEGESVKAGETVIARLANAALLAAKERAVATLAERTSSLAKATVAHTLAQARRTQTAEARTAVAEARTAVAEAAARLATARGRQASAAAEARSAQAALTAQEQLAAAGGSNTLAVERARAAAAGAEAAVATAAAEAAAGDEEHRAALARFALAEELLANPVDLDGAVATAAAELAEAAAAEAAGRTELAIAERELQWTEVRAPSDGIVLRLLSTPGAQVGPDSDGILAIYDPRHLRARIDVPLGSIGSVTPGQAVELRSEVTGSAIVRGVVQRLQHESDLLKNTLQVKVALLDPPPLLRPETLCRARFLGGAAPAESAPTAAFLVPKAAVHGDTVFVFDPARRVARAIAVQKVGEQGEDALVRGELSVTQRVVLAAVADGEAIREERP